jgi:mannitol 2-dehydrogenase
MSTHITTKNLGELAKKASVPGYDVSQLSIGICHIGVGGFHRAHQAVYLDDLFNKKNDLSWAYCGIGILPHDKKIADVFSEQESLYALKIKDELKQPPRIIGSIRKFIHADQNPEDALSLLAAPSTRIVTLTVTEGGYYYSESTGELLTDAPAIKHDLSTQSKFTTFLGYIVEALARRRASGVPPFTVLSCDNLQGNGHIAKKVIISFARLKDAALADWIERQVTFPCCMVDRITPVTTDEDKKSLSLNDGIDDQWPVVCEDFKQWVVEDHFCNGRPALEDVGVQFVSDVTPYEKMKIRLLNASHSAMGYLGYLAGFRYIDDIARDPEFARYIKGMMDQEVTPILPAVPGVDLSDYKQTLLRRFTNPHIRDQAARICMDGSAKMPKFILPSIQDNIERNSSFKRLALCVAAWIRYLKAVDEQGEPIEIKDPLAKELLKAAAGVTTTSTVFFDALPDVIPAELRSSKVFIAVVDEQLKLLSSVGARRTLQMMLA